MEVVTHWFQEVPALASFHVTNWLSTFFKNIHELALSRRVTTKRAAATPVLRRSCFTKFTYKGVCRLNQVKGLRIIQGRVQKPSNYSILSAKCVDRYPGQKRNLQRAQAWGVSLETTNKPDCFFAKLAGFAGHHVDQA